MQVTIPSIEPFARRITFCFTLDIGETLSANKILFDISPFEEYIERQTMEVDPFNEIDEVLKLYSITVIIYATKSGRIEQNYNFSYEDGFVTLTKK